MTQKVQLVNIGRLGTTCRVLLTRLALASGTTLMMLLARLRELRLVLAMLLLLLLMLQVLELLQVLSDLVRLLATARLLLLSNIELTLKLRKVCGGASLRLAETSSRGPLRARGIPCSALGLILQVLLLLLLLLLLLVEELLHSASSKQGLSIALGIGLKLMAHLSEKACGCAPLAGGPTKLSSTRASLAHKSWPIY